MGYSASDLLTAIQNPGLVRGEIRKFGQRFNRWYHDKFYENESIDIFEEDRDNLIILDECRYDSYEELNDIHGEIDSRISRGSSSWEFFQGNFEGRKLHDTVYITANPHLYRLNNGIFHAVVDLLEYWDDDLQTVPPSEIASKGEETRK